MWAVLVYDRALTQVDFLAKSVTPQASPTERGRGEEGGIRGHAQLKISEAKMCIPLFCVRISTCGKCSKQVEMEQGVNYN